MRWFVLLNLFLFVKGTVFVDIETVSNTTYILFPDKQFSCTPKTPPLSHGWSLECEEY